MGKWNRKWIPRRMYQSHQDPPRPHYMDPPSGFWKEPLQDNVPSWEKEYCASVGCIPWRRVVNAQKFMIFRGDVLQWDDSAGEEAFQNAKKRFWSGINGVHCDITLPDPDLYIDEVDWNPQIDPQLVLESDKAYVAPENAGKYGNLQEMNQTENNLVFKLQGDEKNQSSGNPWEGGVNPWEGECSQGNRGWDEWAKFVHDSNMDSDHKLSGWKQTENNGENGWEKWHHRARALKDDLNEVVDDNSWKNNRNGGPQKDKEWEYFGVKPWETSNNGENRWGAQKDKSWGRNNQWKSNTNESRVCNNGGNSWGWKQNENRVNDPKELELKRVCGESGSWNPGRKRGSFYQDVQRFKTPRFQGDYNQMGHHWKKGRDNKRVCFVAE